MTYLDEMFGLDGKTAVVSGGAGVIGTVMSEALLRAGARVMIWSRSQESVDGALEKLNEMPGSESRVAGMRVDAGKEDEVAQALQETIASFASPDILINGVGGNIGKYPLIEQDMELFEKVMHMNLAGEQITGYSYQGILTLSWETSTFATGYEYCVDSVDNDTCDTSWVSSVPGAPGPHRPFVTFLVGSVSHP